MTEQHGSYQFETGHLAKTEFQYEQTLRDINVALNSARDFISSLRGLLSPVMVEAPPAVARIEKMKEPPASGLLLMQLDSTKRDVDALLAELRDLANSVRL